MNTSEGSSFHILILCQTRIQRGEETANIVPGEKGPLGCGLPAGVYRFLSSGVWEGARGSGGVRPGLRLAVVEDLGCVFSVDTYKDIQATALSLAST